MALPKTDSFTAANQDLSTYSANWVDMYADHARIVSNAVTPSAAPSDEVSYWNGDTFADDHTSQVVLGVTLSFTGPGVRLNGTTPGFTAAGYLWVPGLGNVYKISSSGGLTQIASGWTVPSVGATCKLEIVGDQLTGYNDGVQAGTVSDSTYATGGFPGFYLSGGGGATVDDFVGDNFPPTSAGDTQEWRGVRFLRSKPWRGKRRPA